jgi:cephalosporin hydroxylase
MTDYMEENLDTPVGRILPVIQEGIMRRTTYFGIAAKKSPMDAWVYQEIIFETRPDVIVEIGNADGGSTLFLAHLCDLLGKGRVIGLDLSHRTVSEQVKNHPRITLIEMDACEGFEYVERQISKEERTLVIEDSSHAYDNTLNILRRYSGLIRPGDYFIVEDGICHHGLDVGPKPGPYEAVEAFINENKDFEIDRSREHFFITWNPKGYLRRTAPGHSYGKRSDPYSRKGVSRPSERVREVLRLLIPPILLQLMGRLVNRR